MRLTCTVVSPGPWRSEVVPKFTMERRLLLSKSRAATIIGLATNHKAYTRSQCPANSIIEESEQNNRKVCYGSDSSEQIAVPMLENLNKCTVTTVNEHQNIPPAEILAPMSTGSTTKNKADESVSTNVLEDLRFSGSSDDDDFGSSSSDNYICDTDESSSNTDNSIPPAKKSKAAISVRNNFATSEIPSPATTANIFENPQPGCSFWINNGTNSAEKNRNSMHLLPLNLTSSDDENSSAKKGRTNSPGWPHIIVPETPSPLAKTSEDPPPSSSFWERNGMNSAGKKKKPRKSDKERRQDRAKRKLFRNTGLEYNTLSGKIKKNRELRDLDDCRQKCRERLALTLRNEIFEKYWSLGSYTSRTEYIARCIEVRRKITSKRSPKRKRKVSFRYYVTGLDHTKHPICKGCFLKTFDESHKFLQTVCEKLRDNGGHLPPPKRRLGKCIPDHKLEEIKAHIACFPSTESHYGRKKTTKRFLNSELNIKILYKLYKPKTDNPVSKTIFKKVFDTMNLSFKKPSVDTCSKCDSLNMKLKYASEELAQDLKKTLEEHQEAFKAAYEEKRADKELAQSCEDVMVITFDLQQCLPTPFLQTSVAFYKRQLWTFNLTIHDMKTDKAYCYMWPECDGNRGANDIGSCLYDFIINHLPILNPNAKKLIMYSDSCPGQNKNSIITTMLMLVAKLSPQLQSIEHKFLVPGHTHMEADTDHALIERKKKNTCMDIHLPRDWYQLVRTASNKTAKFTVVEMTRDKFYDFNIFLKQCYTFRKNNTDNQKFVWADVRSILYTKENISRFYYKKEFKECEYMTIDCGKRGKSYDMITLNAVPKAYPSKIAISTEKKKDLLNLLCFIHEGAHEFYRSLSCKNDVKDTPPDIDIESDEE